jgi:hypothetical protein
MHFSANPVFCQWYRLTALPSILFADHVFLRSQVDLVLALTHASPAARLVSATPDNLAEDEALALLLQTLQTAEDVAEPDDLEPVDTGDLRRVFDCKFVLVRPAAWRARACELVKSENLGFAFPRLRARLLGDLLVTEPQFAGYALFLLFSDLIICFCQTMVRSANGDRFSPIW